MSGPSRRGELARRGRSSHRVAGRREQLDRAYAGAAPRPGPRTSSEARRGDIRADNSIRADLLGRRPGVVPASRTRLVSPRRSRMSVDLVRIVDSIHRDKNIPKEVLFEGIESALATAAKKHFPDAEEIQVTDRPGHRQDPDHRRRPEGRPPRLRPDRRADRQAGHHPEDPRGRARQHLRRVRRPARRAAHRHRQAVRGRRRHRRPRPRDATPSCPAPSRSPARATSRASASAP